MSDGPGVRSVVDPASFCNETLQRLGELRADRLNNPKYMYRAVLFYASGVGALGVFSGYALYLKVEPIVHVGRGAGLMLAEIAIAVLLGVISE